MNATTGTAEFGNFETLQGIENHLRFVYGEREDIHLPTVSKRISALQIKFGGLVDLIDEGGSIDEKEKQLARCVSWAACVARSRKVSLQGSLALKYPVCPRCGGYGCSCDPKNKAPTTLNDSLANYAPQTLSGWQDHLKTMYHANNSKNGIWWVTTRTYREISEILEVEENVFDYIEHKDASRFRRAFSLEVADSTAWLLGTASMIGVDAQTAVIKHYGNGCGTCGQEKCGCSVYSLTVDGSPFDQ